ncbi:hypothetical protein [uncultured Alteromonas sp.]|uniref:thermonuclease family protein n=1 Tax=uncultured Alteromonas sp. TaxID=179113 RepID=UPI0030CC10BD|tara:strand:+ start:18255 stop:18932 length:678 start_codon:yes stop_codon:yes gene_type:complete
MRLRILGLIVLMFSSIAVADSQKTFFGKVLEVDGHNVFTVGDSQGRLRILSLAYISTPVRDEPFFKTVNDHLQTFVGNWYQFTIVSYGINASVKPVLMRDQEQKSVNSFMVRNGMAMVNIATNPPPSLIDQGYEASNNKIGLWGQEEQFNPLSRSPFSAFDLSKMLSTKGKDGLVPYFKVEETKMAYPVGCGIAFPDKKMDIALTAHVAKKQGYTVTDDCSELFD